MTTERGIAVVSRAMSHLVISALHRSMPEAEISMGPPHDQQGASHDTPRVNIYLVNVAHDSTLRSNALPTRDEPADLVATPTVALELHYLVSFFGPPEPAQLMAGVVELAFHERPHLDAELIAEAVRSTPALQGSNLDRQDPSVRIQRQHLSLNEISSLGSGLFRGAYTLSTLYAASPVLLTGEIAPPSVVPSVSYSPD